MFIKLVFLILVFASETSENYKCPPIHCLWQRVGLAGPWLPPRLPLKGGNNAKFYEAYRQREQGAK